MVKLRFRAACFKVRNNHRKCSTKKDFLENFAIFTEKHLCWGLFLVKLQALGRQLYQKETPAQVSYCEYCKIFKNSYLEEHLRMAASAKLLVLRNFDTAIS